MQELSPQFETSGQIEDSHGPVPFSMVRYQNQRHWVWTDRNGQFQLPMFPESKRLTATKSGYLISGTESKTNLQLLPILPDDDPRYRWVEPGPNPMKPGQCANCHRGIFDEWAASKHARSATDEAFLMFYDGSTSRSKPDRRWNLLHEYPDGSGVCASCHAPTVEIGLAEDFDLAKAIQPKSLLNGVHCDFCHKIESLGQGEIGLTHGRDLLKLSRPAPGEQRFFGPLPDVDRGEDVYSPFQRDSRLCAACHEGTIFGIPVYTTYSEWLESPAAKSGKSCQGCHMAPTGKMMNIAPGHGGLDRPPHTLGNHRFFNESQAAMLRRSVQFEIRSQSQNLQNRTIDIDLRATKIGHSLPTGYIDHHLILVIENATSISGPKLNHLAGENDSGKPGFLFAKIVSNGEGINPVPFWQGDRNQIVDTRLKPDAWQSFRFEVQATNQPMRMRLIYRRFWEPIARQKGIKENEIILFDEPIQ